MGFLFLPGELPGQHLAFQFPGYAKNLAIRSSSLLTKQSFFLDISRFRQKALVDFSRFFHAEVWLDTELLLGSFLQSQEFQFRDLVERPTFADLDWTLSDGDDHHVQQRLFRAVTTVYVGPAAVTLGRQRIAWGTGFVWNPTDLLNPFNPAGIELDEKEGVDAAYLAFPLGSLSRLELAYAPGRQELQSSSAFRISTNVYDYDLTLMAGHFQDDYVLGGDFAGYIGGAGFRGEFAFTVADEQDNYLRAIVNADYSFASGLYVFAEFYLNGRGATRKQDYDFTELLSGQTFNLARYYFATSLSKSLTPLFGANFYSILNLTDQSALIGPALTYSLAQNLDLTVSAYFLAGDDDTEYGQLSSSYFGYVQFYF